MSSNHKSLLTKSQQKKLREFIAKAKAPPYAFGQRSGEVIEYHPVVAEWLTANGYEHQHHVRLEDFGIVDFLATHSDGHKLLVEAKYRQADIRKAILQVRVYQVQMPDALAAVIAPTDTIRDGDVKAAEKHGVKIIAVEFPGAAKPQPKPDVIVIYQCPDCGQYFYPAGRGPVGMELLEQEGVHITVLKAETPPKPPDPTQQSVEKKSTKRKPKPIHAWPPLPGEKKHFS